MIARAPGRAAPSAAPASPAKRGPVPATGSAAQAQRRFGNTGTARIVAGRGAVRPKLSVGAANDPFEREADAVADKVVRMKPGGACAACSAAHDEEEATVRRASDAGGSAGGGHALTPHAASRIDRATRGGDPLPANVRASMEPRFGADFSGVRVHRGGEAADSAAAIGARAYTLGNHIAFGEGQWAPGTERGDRLLAHELTHTLQDRSGATARTVRGDFLDDLSDAAGAVADAASGAASAVGNAASSAVYAAGAMASDVANAAAELAVDAAGAVSNAAGAVANAAGAAVDWMLTEAGALAIAAANGLAQRFGGGVVVGPDGLIITLPNIPLFDTREFQITPPAPRAFITLAAAGAALGPVVLIGRIGIPLSPPIVHAFLGPGRLQNIQIRVDPFGGVYSAGAEFYMGAAINGAVETGLGARVDALTVIPTEPPIPVEASLEGGLLAVLNASAVGSLQQGVLLSYDHGDLGLDLATQLRLGLIFGATLNGYLNAQLYDFEICEWIWPIDGAHWEASTGVQMDLPISLTYSGGGLVVDVGELTAIDFPARDIETGLVEYQPQSHCLSWRDVIDELCKRNILPPELCPEPEEKKTPTPPPVGPGPAIGPQGAALPKIYIDPGRFPESAAHARQAMNAGEPDRVTIDRPGASSRRRKSVGAYKKKHDCDGANHRKPPCAKSGQDYDEYPQAMFSENGGAAHVKPISAGDNRGSGSSVGQQCRPHSNSTRVKIVIGAQP